MFVAPWKAYKYFTIYNETHAPVMEISEYETVRTYGRRMNGRNMDGRHMNGRRMNSRRMDGRRMNGRRMNSRRMEVLL